MDIAGCQRLLSDDIALRSVTLNPQKHVHSQSAARTRPRDV
jgi:hypothetical protein